MYNYKYLVTTYLYIIFINMVGLSFSLQGMQTLTNTIVNQSVYSMVPHLYTRNLMGCSCIKNFKPEIGTPYYVAQKDIEERKNLYYYIHELARHKEVLQKEGKWPCKEGNVLINTLESKTLCHNFNTCAQRVTNKETRADIGKILGSIYSIGILFWAGGDPILQLSILGGLGTTFYSIISYEQSQHYLKILSDIAWKDLHKLRPAYSNFKKNQKK